MPLPNTYSEFSFSTSNVLQQFKFVTYCPNHKRPHICSISIFLPNKLKCFHFSLQITYDISDHHFCSSFSCLHPAHSFLEVNYAKQDAVCPYSGCEELKNYSTRILGYASAYTVQNVFSSFQVKDHFEFQFFVLKICPRTLSTHRNLIPSSKSNEE